MQQEQDFVNTPLPRLPATGKNDIRLIAFYLASKEHILVAA